MQINNPDSQKEYLKSIERQTDELYRLKVENDKIFRSLIPYFSDHELELEYTINGKTETRKIPFVREILTSKGERREVTISPESFWDYIGKLTEQQLREEFERKLGWHDQTVQNDEKERLVLENKINSLIRKAQNGLAIHQQIQSSLEDRVTREFKNFRLRELVRARKALRELEIKMEANRMSLEEAYGGESTGGPDFDLIMFLEEEYKRLYQQYQDLLHSSPEAFIWKAYQNLIEIKRVFDERGTMVETPYVREKVSHILHEIQEGKRPVFIHGELSTGKTELAKHICRRYLSRPYLERWEKEHPKPSDPKKIEEWEEARRQAMEPLEVRGVRSLEKEDLTTTTLLEREEKQLPEEYVKSLMKAKQRFEEEVIKPAASSIPDEEERRKFTEEALKSLEEAYLANLRSSGIITVEKLSPIFQAMKEGRPVIIDEINAIPHHVLIVLNDIITRKPGDIVFTPRGEAIKIQEGFAIIATGNWKPEDSILYPGRSVLDAAFLSRFGIVEYDYLPQNIALEKPDVEPETLRKERQENELFMMLMVRLIDNNLGAYLPEDGIEQLKRLASAARLIQDVFSGKLVSTAYYARGGKIDPKDVLKENVLAFRQLFPIIERWKREGFVRPLDDYLFLEYVYRSSARPEEMKYLYNILQTMFGFFQDSDWPQSTGESDEDVKKIRDYNIVRKMYGVDSLSLASRPIPIETNVRYFSPLEIIEHIYGPIPERTTYPQVEYPQTEIAKDREQERIDAIKAMRETIDDPHVPEEIKEQLKEMESKL
ncbi:MAG: AAA family ATPase [Nitrososphaerota archaeon]|nr:AAA family ATPase [Nitrososphaerota archaeon]